MKMKKRAKYPRVYRIGLLRLVDQGQIWMKRWGEGDMCRNVRTCSAGQQGETQDNNHSEDNVCLLLLPSSTL